VYKSKQKLNIHMRLHRGESDTPFKVTSENKPFKCDFQDCSKAFRHLSEYKRHSMRHNGIKKLGCPWPGCSARFVENGDLKKHMKWHVGEKLFLCTYPGCGKRFLHSSNLNLHSRYHKDEPAFHCEWPGCQYATNNKSNLKTHKRKHTKHLNATSTNPTNHHQVLPMTISTVTTCDEQITVNTTIMDSNCINQEILMAEQHTLEQDDGQPTTYVLNVQQD
jgi:uncharacterized Zn-finger protein